MATIERLSLCSPKFLLPNMSYVSLTWPLSFLRMRLTVGSPVSQWKSLHCKNMQLHDNHWSLSTSKKNTAKTEPDDISDEENINSDSKKNKRPTRRSRKKSSKETTEEIIPADATTEITLDQGEKTIEPVGLSEELRKIYMRLNDPSMVNLVASILPLGDEGESEEEITKSKRGRKKKTPTEPDLTSYEVPTQRDEQEKEDLTNLEKAFSNLLILEREKIERDYDLDSISQDYSWPPLVICFGPAKASFLPYARPANRIFDQKIHQAMHELYWSPDQFFRASGCAASSVAIALAGLDGRVEFMGKLGADSLGRDLLYKLNVNGVQTRCMKIDDSVSTAVSRMKLTVDGGCLKAECVEPCAEDSFSSSDINLDILKEAKMLYFNTSALLDLNSKLTVMEAINIMKSQGGLIFFDVNLPLPLWHSPEETKSFLKESFAVSNFIELTQQELDFLCGNQENVIENETDAMFVHRSREEVKEVLHDGLEVLFVTNGTSRISYYTRDNDGFVNGTEDVQIEPSSCDMSASGDAVVAELMSSMVSEPDMATDPSYLGTTIKQAILSGVIAQTLVTEDSGFYSSKQPDDYSDQQPNDNDQDNQTMTTQEDAEGITKEKLLAV